MSTPDTIELTDIDEVLALADGAIDLQTEVMEKLVDVVELATTGTITALEEAPPADSGKSVSELIDDLDALVS